MLKILKNLITLPFQSDQKQDDFIAKIINLSRKKAKVSLASAQLEDCQLSYLQRSGDKNLPTVVLLHGFSANKDHWLSFSHSIDKRFQVIIPDLAGHGDSSKEMTQSYDLSLQAQRLNQLLELLNISQCHILGNSMGGAISALLFMQRPEKIASLALMDSAGFEGDSNKGIFNQLEQGHNPLIPETISEHKKFMRWVMHKPPFMPWPFSRIIARQALQSTALNKKIFADMLASREYLLKDNFELSWQKLCLDKKLPVFVLWGEQDKVLDVSCAYKIQQLIPYAEINILPEYGHLPMLECPTISGQMYQEFLAAR